jgi:phosphohistidine swiveling domain-containing protein
MIYKSKEKWIVEAERSASLRIIYQLAMVYSFNRDYPKLRINMLFPSRGQIVKIIYSSEVIEKAKYLLKRARNNSNFLKDYLAKRKVEIQHIKKLAGEYLAVKDYSKLTNLQLVTLVEKYRKYYTQASVVPIRFLNKSANDLVLKYHNDLATLFANTKESQINLEEKKFLELLRQIKLKDKKINKKILTHFNKYQWMPCGYFDEPAWELKDLMSRIKAAVKNKVNPVLELSKINKNRKNLLFKRKLLIKKLKLPSDVRRIIKIMSEFTYSKDYIRFSYNYLHWASYRLFNEIARRLKIDIDSFKYLTTQEIIDYLSVGKISNDVFKRRKINYLVIARKGGLLKILDGELALQKEKSELEFRVMNDKKEIKGMTANKGKANGFVQVIKTPKEFNNKIKDSILVVPMTTPEFVGILKNVKAIVTDEGGVTCHAAIVSRELDIPCVIGTKVATQIFKNGDKVEVDADKGIIKKIK